MKKLLAVTLLSMSICTTSVGYSQSLYTGGGYQGSAGLGTETNVGTENYAVWIFRGITFLSFLLALYAAWDDLNAWLADGGGNRQDERIVGVCEFYEKYKDIRNLGEMGQILKEKRACSRCSRGKP